jgi:hypothetical protein
LEIGILFLLLLSNSWVRAVTREAEVAASADASFRNWRKQQHERRRERAAGFN